ncbi:hypothetical protein [Bacillus sp. FJAT-49736]|uniref:hypothetical protein n=1 Tax=Bacillus sp. FJAT-49736 TaxID=2833582 RepID=UPI001BC98E76|nr:hypothetical protein [Bacillus sp. FJAT-49736]MBS4174412.1 hypothetical protein [Bacillus sp. FJAT-49736]
MFLTEMNLRELILKQYTFKLHAYIRVFSSLIATQLIAILVSLAGVGSSGTSMDGMQLNITYYSADMIIILTIVWAFFSSILITTKAYRFDDFTFISTRLSSNVANVLFLTTMSTIGGATAMFAGNLLKAIIFVANGTRFIENGSILDAPQNLLIGIVVSILYIMFFSALGYLFGILIQLYKPLVILIPVALIGFSIIQAIHGKGEAMDTLFKGFFMESSIWVFVVKALLSSILLFACAGAISNRMEVRN